MENPARSVLRTSLPALAAIALLAVALPACRSMPPPAPDDPVSRGRAIFFNETFAGNGRTCGSCHPAENNFTIDPTFIATLPDDDPLFVAETNPALAVGFENPRLMRQFGLIVENLDGFDDLANVFTMRGVPHTLAQPISIDSPAGPRTGWSGDGSPGDRSLRSFAVGAVIQHFPKTLGRVAGVDFRLPTDGELNDLEAFMLSLGRQRELSLPLSLRGQVAARGQAIFLDNGLGKCNICHNNAGANAVLGGNPAGNANFDTGVEALADRPIDLPGEPIPTDDGFGTPGDGTFNTPGLVEAADTPPFFHNNVVRTIEGAVAFYNSPAFNNSPSGRLLASLDPNGVGISLNIAQVEAVAAFLRVINALENIREGIAQLDEASGERPRQPRAALLSRAVAEIEDARQVLDGAGLHPRAATLLRQAEHQVRHAARRFWGGDALVAKAREHLQQARARLVEG